MNSTEALDVVPAVNTTVPYNISDYFNDSSLFDFDGTLRGLVGESDVAEYSIFDSPAVRTTFILLYSLVFFFCFFGNLAVVLVVTLHWRMRSITKFCLGNLAFANLCVGIFCVYQNLSTFLIDTWVFGRLLCKMYHFTNSLSHTASILILVVICVERYMAILHPFRFRRILTITRLRLTIVCVWLISAVLCSPRLYYITTYEIPVPAGPDGGVRYEVICAPQRTLYDSHIVDMINFVVLFIFPLGVISFLYARVGLTIWKGSSALRGPMPATETESFDHTFPQAPPNSVVSDMYSSAASSSGATTSGASSSSRSRASGAKRRFWRSYRVRRFVRRLRPRARRRKPRYSSPAESPVRSEGDSRVLQGLQRSNAFKRPRRSPSYLVRASNNNLNHKEPMGRIEYELPSRHQGFIRRDRSRPAGIMRNGSLRAPETLLLAVTRSPRLHSPRTDCSLFERGGEEIVNGNAQRVEEELLEAEEEERNRLLRPPIVLDGSSPLQANSCPRRIPTKVAKRLIHMADVRRNKLLKSRQAVIRVLIAIVVTFAICNLPFHLRKICQYYVRSYNFGSDVSYLVTALTFLLMYTNCAINPILYAFLSKSFRSSLQDVLKLRLRRRQEVRRRTSE